MTHSVMRCIALLALLTGGCGTGPISEDADGVGASAVTATVAALSADAGPKLDTPCDPENGGGWHAAQVKTPPGLQQAINRGEPVMIPIPPGYEHRPPKGKAHCEKRSHGNFWAVHCNSDADCPAGTMCPFDNADMKCEVICSSDADCMASTVCRKRGMKPSMLCTCDAPNWCDAPEVSDQGEEERERGDRH
jgi:hypothetical protein